MTKQEMVKVFYILRANFDKYYKDLPDTRLKTVMQTWFKAFNNYSYEELEDAVINASLAKQDGFPPSMGLVNSFLKTPTITALEGWSLVDELANKANYDQRHDKSLWEKLPEIVRKAFPFRVFDSWIRGNAGDTPYVRSMFLKSFGEAKEITERESLLLENNTKLLEGEDGK